MLIVTVKYVILVMRADYNGEGGIIALMSLAQQTAKRRSVKLLLGMTGVIGACLFFGDGIITPAVSVISAIEGIEVSFPAASHLVVPLSIVVLIGLFSIQFHGTGRIGIIFGPVMVVWFLMIGILGVLAIIHHPGILLALSPIYAIMFIAQHGYLSFLALGSVVLAVTGAEALYADMSHFGRRPIREAWLFLSFPVWHSIISVRGHC
ncbi:putative potassium transport system protein kup (plasmid) [Acetobacter pasteurianus subsp. pasteurianus]|uniref:Potassium transport system protein kup n=1 Tax=Acetobacter pasteurianus subsp. pasteurianus TaxID=481145 RepID=A0AAC9X2M5_ACEPA|nr:putative potassium transport system protein kup [Acetobacter pasteurianus subsp. pasteurianus]